MRHQGNGTRRDDRQGLFALPLMLAYASAIVWAVHTHQLPVWVLAALPALSVVTFVVYWHDKHAAQTGQWRIKESTLHLFGLAGGWPGAWFAHRWLRHKSKKAEFRMAYWGTVVVHCAVVGGWLGWPTT